MRLLIFTQKIDKNDSILGFFHTWLIEISKKFDSVSVICLELSEFDLPKNVTVFSLGKEKEVSKFVYVWNLYKYLFLISGTYEAVFIHMNQEYVLLAGLYWKMKNTPIYLWRNHPRGSVLTRMAVAMSTKVFCTSNQSFTARFKKTVIMPAGIDTRVFKPVPGVVRKKYSACVVGRIAPIKHVEVALEAVNILVKEGTQISLTIVGSPQKKDFEYFNSLKKYAADQNLSNVVSFVEAVAPESLPEIYSSHEICLNLTESGSFDKTIVESASCGAIPLVTSSAFEGMLPPVCITTSNPRDIADSLKKLLTAHEQVEVQDKLKSFVDSQSLSALMDKLVEEIK